MTERGVIRIAGIGLVTADLPKARAFYAGALGFEPVASGAGDDLDPEALGLAGATRRWERMRLGEQEIRLEAFAPPGRPYPRARAANDPGFQHFAIAVGDMGAAYGSATRGGGAAISTGGPQLLPPSTGSVTAYKFRDPEGHPLELSLIPGSRWTETAGGGVFLGIDHTALAVSDFSASLEFYTRLGLRPGGRFLNRGAEQDRLDGLDGVELDIAVLTTPAPGPHIELLHYRSPPPRNPGGEAALNDVGATRTCFEVRGLEALLDEVGDRRRVGRPSALAAGRHAFLRDPDGHILELTEVGTAP